MANKDRIKRKDGNESNFNQKVAMYRNINSTLIWNPQMSVPVRLWGFFGLSQIKYWNLETDTTNSH